MDHPDTEQPIRQRRLHITRNGGPLLGRLHEILPCLYIAQRGASYRDLRTRTYLSAPGLFAINERTEDHPPRVSYRVGLILPLSRCRDAAARKALHQIARIVDNHQSASLFDRRQQVRERLHEAFGEDLVMDDRDALGGFLALKPGAGLFRRLSESFDYLTEVIDNSEGGVQITGTAPFRWRSYGEFMEWFHDVRDNNRFGSWQMLTPLLVSGNTVPLASYCTERWARSGLHRPTEDPSRWFTIRSDLHDAEIGIRLEMEEYGWAKLHLTLDNATVAIDLSEVFDPFPELLAWGQECDEGELPVQMEIDEEGQEAVLTLLPTDDPRRALFRVTRRYENQWFIEGIISRAEFASTLKAELIRFFKTDFDPRHWDDPDEDDTDDDTNLYGQTPTRERVLRHPWLSSR